MPRETICVYCEKPLLDAEHAKKHVLEQCPKAPWRGRLAELEATNTRLDKLLAKCATDYADLNEANTRLRDELERVARELSLARIAQREVNAVLAERVAANTPLRARVAALEKQLSGVEADRDAPPSTRCPCPCHGLVKALEPDDDCALCGHRLEPAGAPAVTGTTSDKAPFRNLGRCGTWRHGAVENLPHPQRETCHGWTEIPA
jgi:hypothetical protein